MEKEIERERRRVMNAGLVSVAIMETDRATYDGGSDGQMVAAATEKCAGRPDFPDM